MSRKVSIATCQYHVRPINSFKDLATRVSKLLDASQDADIAIFPELFTIELFTTLANWQNLPISELTRISEFTAEYKALFLAESKK